MTWFRLSTGKSGSREVGFFLMALWVFLVLWTQFFEAKDAFFERNFDSITTAVFAFGMGAFGIQAVFNRLGAGAPPQPAPRVPLRGNQTSQRRPPVDDDVE